ncbi:hypothetical protein GDO78_023171 [Eleutherodactylus coqui]|uniref:Rna-directed dna polymerase from mobile element jockey-like n=1 Tax=Eleutherodactylus coqui TaxID=57060 RepID=A0A8J6B3V8_ELECQ|nr:hypothetical protein GDO78_023171 [Eleutherodactylus coqui]
MSKAKEKSKDAIGCLQDDNGELVKNDFKKTKLLNSYFVSFFSQKVDGTATDLPCAFGGIKECRLSVSREMVRENLANLHEFKSQGPDELHPRILKEAAEEIAEPLVIIFENSWRIGEAPEDWKRSNVVPIFKKREESVSRKLQACEPDFYTGKDL